MNELLLLWEKSILLAHRPLYALRPSHLGDRDLSGRTLKIIIVGWKEINFIETTRQYMPIGYWFPLAIGALAFLCVAAASSLLTHLWLTYAMTWAQMRYPMGWMARPDIGNMDKLGKPRKSDDRRLSSHFFGKAIL